LRPRLPAHRDGTLVRCARRAAQRDRCLRRRPLVEPAQSSPSSRALASDQRASTSSHCLNSRCRRFRTRSATAFSSSRHRGVL